MAMYDIYGNPITVPGGYPPNQQRQSKPILPRARTQPVPPGSQPTGTGEGVPYGVNTLSPAARQFMRDFRGTRGGASALSSDPLSDEIARLRSRGETFGQPARGEPAPVVSPEESGLADQRVGPPPGRVSAPGTSYLPRSGEVPERRVYESRGGMNLPGNVAADVEAGLARSPIMEQAARMRATQLQEESDNLNRQQQNFISGALQSAALNSGAGTISSMVRTRANMNTAMGLERNRTARDVAAGRTAADLNVARIGAGATRDAAGARARASEIAARYGLAGSQVGAAGRENAARIAAMGRIGQARVTAAGQLPTLNQVAAQRILGGGGDDSARIAYPPRAPRAPSVTNVPGVPGLTPSGAIISDPNGQVSFRTTEALSQLTKRQDVSAAAAKLDVSGQPPGAEVPIPGHPDYIGIVDKNGKLRVVPVGGNK
jgi:hypothetical protein